MRRLIPALQAAMIACFQLVLLGFALAMVRFATTDTRPALAPHAAATTWTAAHASAGD